MASSPSDTSATAKAFGHFDYEAWVRAQLNVPPDALILEQPESDTVARIEEARARNVETIVCGFLPDEIDWPQMEWNACTQFFVERFIFKPYVLKQENRERERCASVVLVGHGYDLKAAISPARVLARSWSEALNEPLTEADAGMVSESELATLLSSASMVFSHITDWSFGFAIDAFCSSRGIRTVRLAGNRYSPLRYAVLGQRLEYPMLEIPRLRARMAPSTAHNEATSDDGNAWNCFEDDDRTAVRWQTLYGAKAFADFWGHFDWQRAVSKPTRLQGHWLSRADAWAALAAMVSSDSFQPATRRCAVKVMTEWLLAEQRNSMVDWLREEAIVRWVLRHPEWLTNEYRKASGEAGDAKKAVARWLERIIQCERDFASIVQVTEAGEWALDPGSALAHLVRLSACWAGNWSAVPQLLSATISLDWRGRSLLLVAWSARLREMSRIDGERSSGRDPEQLVVASREPWSLCFGAAGDFVRSYSALRLGRRDIVREAVRHILGASGATTQGGGARLVRAAFSTEAEFHAWLRDVAGPKQTGKGGVLPRLIHAWSVSRRWELWRIRTPFAVMAETGIALRTMQDIKASGSDAGEWMLLGRLAALHEDVDSARIAVEALHRANDRAAELAGSAALALWLRGNETSAQILLENWPEAETDPFATHFVRAVALQLLGDSSGAARVLNRVFAAFPHFGRDKMNEAHLMWGAVVFIRAGLEAEAATLRSRARAINHETDKLPSDVLPGNAKLANDWRKLYQL